MKKHHEVAWRIIPQNTPQIIRHCSKCNRKMRFYCSEKFRLNANSKQVDIWLIYKCSKCDTTWKLTLMRGVKPHDLSAEHFGRLTNNDKALAWQYAFDRQLLKQNDCEIDYSNICYVVEGCHPKDAAYPLHVQLESQYFFDLKLSAFLAKALDVSVGSVKKLVSENLITTTLDCDIMRYKIRADFDLFIKAGVPTAP